MDWTTLLTALLSFLGGGGLGAVLMYPTNRKSADLENEKKASEQWRELFMQADEDKKKQSALIDKLYDDQSRFRDENNRLTTQVAVFSILKCRNLKCIHRNPPLEYSATDEDKTEEIKDETDHPASGPSEA